MIHTNYIEEDRIFLKDVWGGALVRLYIVRRKQVLHGISLLGGSM